MQEELDPIEIIDTHLEQFFEEDEVIVFHELDTPEDENHIDIYWIRAPKDIMDYAILLTVGISRVEQNLEGDYDAPNFIEVMMLVPWDWNFSDYHWTDDEYWPIHHLKTIAKIPSTQNTWYGYGHSIDSAADNSLIKGTNFKASVLLETITLTNDFVNIKVDDEKTIHIFSAVPIYPEELDFKIKHSAGELIDKFNRYRIDEVVDINRRNTCKKRWWQWR